MKKKLLNWNEYYLLALNYYNHYGNINIDINFKTIDGINYNIEGYELGKWIDIQKKVKKIYYLKKRKLKNIGIDINTKNYKWSDYYLLALNYYNYYGNININIDFKTIDGINYDAEGLTLGNWLNHEKNNTRLSKEKKELLNKLGIIWSNNINYLKVVTPNKEYLIDINKNKGIEKKSYNEIYAKIRYLEDNYYCIMNKEGILHNIFYISDIKIQTIYKVSTEELMFKYLNINKKKK